MNRPIRLLALDLDGTLLDHSGALRPGVRDGLHNARERGILAMICSGRRYRRAADVERLINLGVPMVCNSGSLVKHPSTHQTLWRADLEPATLAGVLDHFNSAGFHTVSFNDSGPDSHDFLVAGFPTGLEPFDDYVGQNLTHVQIHPFWMEEARSGITPHFHVCAIGTHDEMKRLDQTISPDIRSRIRTFVQRSPRYQSWMCEVIRADANKWSAVCHIADSWGIPRDQICSIGDDMNDHVMIREAGLGVAMSHAPEVVRAVAQVVLDSNESDSLRRFLDSLTGTHP